MQILTPPPAEALVLAARDAAAAIAATAADRDADAAFPEAEIDVLRRSGLLAAVLPIHLGGANLGTPGTRHALYQVLAHVGRGSLAVGRVFEGHVNALELVLAFGNGTQQARAAADVASGHLFGVWNTQGDDGTALHEQPDGTLHMAGAKTFCSGAGHVTRPVVTGALMLADDTVAGWQMAIVPLDGEGARVVPDSWHGAGMRASTSARVLFDGLILTPESLIGAPGDYFGEPGFNGGAVRFAAVHAGGARALLDATVDFLRETGRTDDPHQRARVAKAAIAAETADLWLLGAARLRESGAPAEAETAYAALVRTAVAEACLAVLDLADRCVGARGLLMPSVVERVGRDLRLYLRQPAPDAVLDAAGAALLTDPGLARGSDV